MRGPSQGQALREKLPLTSHCLLPLVNRPRAYSKPDLAQAANAGNGRPLSIHSKLECSAW